MLVGAAGGVGSFATQLAANAGACLVAVARADAGDRLRSYGAAEVIDYTAGSVPDALRRAHPDGIDVLIDLASDAGGFAALASLVRSGGTARPQDDKTTGLLLPPCLHLAAARRHPG